MSRIDVVTSSMLFGEVKRQPDGETPLHRFFERYCTQNGSCDESYGVRYVDAGDVNEFVSYQSLNLLSNAVARHLVKFCQLTDQSENTASTLLARTIVIDVDPSVNLLIGLLATLKLGLAYVPVDSRSTAINRIKYILQVKSAKSSAHRRSSKLLCSLSEVLHFLLYK